MDANGFGTPPGHIGAVFYLTGQLSTSRSDVVATGFAHRRDDAGIGQQRGKGFHPFWGRTL